MSTSARRRGGRGLDAVAKLSAVAGVALVAVALTSQSTAPPAPDVGTAVSVRAAAPMPRSEPVSISIPAIGVHSPVSPLDVDLDQRLEAPSEPDTVGWYGDSSTPGSAGPAVLAGHVTWEQEPAVLFDLGALRPGQRVHVQRADGRTAVFAITRIAEYDKDVFPHSQVYRPVDEPELRLITCGGTYDADGDTYSANVIAFGTLVAARGR